MERQLKFVLSGEDRSASSTLGKAGDSAESASSKIGGAFSKLGGQIGGEFGEVLNKVGEGLEQTGEKGMSLGKKMAVGGAAIAGVGLLLQAAGSKEKQATDQLKAAIDATGGSYEDYAKQIEKTVKREENFAHSAVDTKTALQTLTQATGDTQTALNNMQLVTDLAAAKHITLAEAAALVAKILGGGGAKTLAAYGVHMKTNADGTKDVSGALDELAAKLNGQAAASMNNFGAKVDVVKTKVGDFIGEWGQKLGGVVTVTGTVLGAASAGLDILAARAARAAAAEAALAAAETTQGAGAVAAAGGTNVLTRALATMTVAEGAATGAGVGLLGGLGLIAVAAGTAYGAVNELANAHGKDHGITKQLSADYKDFANSADTSAKAQATWALVGKSSNSALQGSTRDTAQAVEKLGVSQKDLLAGVLGNDGAYKSLVGTIKAKGGIDKAQLGMLDDLHAAYGAQDAAIKGTASATDNLGTASQDTTKQQASLKTQINDVASKALTATAQLTDMNNALDKLSNNSIDAAQQELRLKDALGTTADHFRAAREQTHQFGKSLDDSTAKGRSNREWMLTQISAINAHATAVGKQTGSVQKATTALAGDTDQLRAAAKAAGLNKGQVDALIKTYAATPKQVATAIKADTDAAKKKIAALQAQIDKLRGKTIEIIYEQRVTGGQTPGQGGGAGRAVQHASGGYLSEGWNTAGEGSATELMYKSGSSVQVLTAGQSRPMLGGGNHIVINLPGLYDGQSGGRAVASMLEKFVAAGGSITVGRGIR